MTRLRNVGVGISLDPASPPPTPHEIATILEKALRTVWQGHRNSEFNWYSWFETARTALMTYDTYARPVPTEPEPLPAEHWTEPSGIWKEP